MNNNKARKRAIYIDDVTTKNYMLSYMNKHMDSNDFSYIVFTYNINGTVHPWNRHGDIFYNGHKLTYINDVCHYDIITDNISHYLGYINHEGALDFAKSYLYVVTEDNHLVRDNFSTFGDYTPEITVKHWSNFKDFVKITNSEWVISEQYSNFNYETNGDDYIIKNNSSIDTSKHFRVSYLYTIENGSNSNTYTDIFDVNFNIYDPVTSVEFFDFPESFDVGQIYTPKLKVTPSNQLSYYKFEYSTQDSGNIELNEQTGRFKCICPSESVSFFCTYGNNNIEKTFKINKLNNHLKMSSTYTSYIWNSADEYSYTTCYVHNYPYCENSNNNDGSKFIIDFTGTNSSDNYIYTKTSVDSRNMSYHIEYDKPGVYKIGAILNKNIYNNWSSYMEIYANVDLAPIDIIYFWPYSNDGQTMTGVIVTATNSTISNLTSTNFRFNSSGKYDNFIITNIVRDGNYTYTYISADVVSDMTYGLIQISSQDDSFLTYTFEV